MGKFCSWNLESLALKSEDSSTESGIPLKIGIRNPSSTDNDGNSVPGMRNPRLGLGKKAHNCL